MKKKAFIALTFALFVANVFAQAFYWRTVVYGLREFNVAMARMVFIGYYYLYRGRHILRAVFFLACMASKPARKSFKYVFPLGIYALLYAAPFFVGHLQERYVSIFLMLLLPISFALFDIPDYRLDNPTKRSKQGIALTCEGFDLPINIPEEGIMILGAPGSGKTYYAIQPILERLILTGRGGIMYDYDFPRAEGDPPSLTQFAYNALKKSGRDSPFYSINFSDVNYSHRMNPIAPEMIDDRAQLRDISEILFKNLSPGMAEKDDFWEQSSTSVFEALVIALQRKAPSCCTIPHLVSILGHGAEKVIKFIRSNEEAESKVPFILSAKKDSPEMFSGVLTSLTTKLARTNNEKSMYVLSGQTFPNNLKEAGAILSIGNVPAQKGAFSPLIAVMLSTLMRGFYHHGGAKSFLAIDELPTLYLPNLEEVPATVRKYGFCTVVALQSLAQLRKRYGRESADAIIESLSNQFVARSLSHSAEYASREMGTVKKKEGNRNVEKRIFTPQDIASMSKGEFVGKVSGSNRTYFHAKLKPSTLDANEKLPKIADVNLSKWAEKIRQEAGEVLE